MPNLVGLRDVPSATSMENPTKEDTLRAMQMEALGLNRRDYLSTTDFKENRSSYVSTVHFESQRLVNRSSIGKGEKSKLEGWNNAWTHLQDDGTNSQKLQDVNEGMGQTHRAKLMEGKSLREYTDESNIQGRRGGRGGRGGGNVGRVTGRGGRAKAKEERRVISQTLSHQPITRVRVPKGERAATQADEPGKKAAPILTTVSSVRSAERYIKTPSAHAASIRRPVVLAAPSAFMASVNRPKEQPQYESSLEIASSATSASKKEATGHSIDTSISETKTPTSSSSEKATAPVFNTLTIDFPSANITTVAGEPAPTVELCPKADLMDLDISQETTQPVLQFTAPSTKKQPCEPVVEVPSSFDQHIEALEKSGVVSKSQLESLKTIQAQVHARANPITPVKEAPRLGVYTSSKLKFLRPAAVAPKVTTGIAREFTEQQNTFLIGEHVHKTRYLTAASLTEDFEKLSISDKKPADSAAMHIPSTEKIKVASDTKHAEPATRDIQSTENLTMTAAKNSAKPAATNLSTTEKSKINPFGPPPAKGKGPSLPAHLMNRSSSADHGEAARVQYLGSHGNLTPVSHQQPLGGFTSSVRPARRNKINETGFIALMEAHAAGKKEEDPLLVAHNRGL